MLQLGRTALALPCLSSVMHMHLHSPSPHGPRLHLHTIFPFAACSVVSRRQLAAEEAVAAKLKAAAARGGSYGVPEASLREAHEQMVQQGAEYSRIFSPGEVADILAGKAAEPALHCLYCLALARLPACPPARAQPHCPVDDA